MKPNREKTKKDVRYTTDPKTHEFTGSLPLGGKKASTPSANKVEKKVPVTEPIVLLSTKKRMLTIYPDGKILETIYPRVRPSVFTADKDDPWDPRPTPAPSASEPVTIPAGRLLRLRYWARIAKANRSFQPDTKTVAHSLDGVDIAWDKYNAVEDEYTKKNEAIAKAVADVARCKVIITETDAEVDKIMEDHKVLLQSKVDEAGKAKRVAVNRVYNPSIDEVWNLPQLIEDAGKATAYEKSLLEMANRLLNQDIAKCESLKSIPRQALAQLEVILAELTGTVSKESATVGTILGLEPTDG